FGNFIAPIGGEIIFLKLGELNFFIAPGKIILCLAINNIRIHKKLGIRIIKFGTNNTHLVVALKTGLHSPIYSSFLKITLVQLQINGPANGIPVFGTLLARSYASLG